MMSLDMEEIDQDANSGTWKIDPSGTMRHQRTGMKVSPDAGISFMGQEYKLGPQDIEFEKDRIGAGACGIVMKGVIKATGERVAVKTIRIDDKARREQFVNEVKGLVSAAGCPHLVQWKAGFVNVTTNAVQVVLEFMDLGSLADLSKRLRGAGMPPNYMANVARQVLLGLSHLHGHHFLHRDIKPENILHNSKGEVKLTDFGIAKDMDSTMAVAGTFVGTVTYMAPERVLGQPYDWGSDIWSVGMVFYVLATGKYPFADISSFPVLYEQLCEKPEPRLEEGLFPPHLCSIVAQCLTRDEKYRPDTQSLLDHQFINEGVPSNEELAAWLAQM